MLDFAFALPVFVVLYVIIKKSLQKYLDEKAKNTASKEDIAKITNEIERVKASYTQRFHSWKHQFEKEYVILEEVWSSVWETQAFVKALIRELPMDMDEKEKRDGLLKFRENEYLDSANKFKEAILQKKPFIPPDVYEACAAIKDLIAEIQTDFDLCVKGGDAPDTRDINENLKKLDDYLEGLNLAIRNRIYGISDASEHNETINQEGSS